MQYILIKLEDGTHAYQCIVNGFVLGYKSLDGETINVTCGSQVIDAEPPAPAWAVPSVATVAPTPEPEPTLVPHRIITKLAYMNKFHDDELVSLYTAAKSIIQIEIWLEKFKVSENIDLDDPRTIGGIHALEVNGLIGPGRAAEILA